MSLKNFWKSKKQVELEGEVSHLHSLISSLTEDLEVCKDENKSLARKVDYLTKDESELSHDSARYLEFINLIDEKFNEFLSLDA